MVVSIGLVVIVGFVVFVVDVYLLEFGVVFYVVFGKGLVGNIVGVLMGWEVVFIRLF